MLRTDWFTRNVELESVIGRVSPAPARSVPPFLDESFRAKTAKTIVLSENSAEWQFRREGDRTKTNVTAEVLGVVVPGTLTVVLAAL
jgi:hypothetical protein